MSICFKISIFLLLFASLNTTPVWATQALDIFVANIEILKKTARKNGSFAAARQCKLFCSNAGVPATTAEATRLVKTHLDTELKQFAAKKKKKTRMTHTKKKKKKTTARRSRKTLSSNYLTSLAHEELYRNHRAVAETLEPMDWVGLEKLISEKKPGYRKHCLGLCKKSPSVQVPDETINGFIDAFEGQITLTNDAFEAAIASMSDLIASKQLQGRGWLQRSPSGNVKVGSDGANQLVEQVIKIGDQDVAMQFLYSGKVIQADSLTNWSIASSHRADFSKRPQLD